MNKMMMKAIACVAVATLMIVNFTSCGGEKEKRNPRITEEEIAAAEKLPLEFFIHYGDDHRVGGAMFYVQLADVGVSANVMDTTGLGYLVACELSLKPDQVENYFPKEGIYDIKAGFTPGQAVKGYLADQGAMMGAPAGVVMMPLGCYSLYIEDKHAVKGNRLAQSGYVKVNGSADNHQILLVYEYADGEKEMFYAEGQKLRESSTKYDTSLEPTTPTTLEGEATGSYFGDYGDRENMGLRIVKAEIFNNEKGKELGAVIELVLPMDKKSLEGKYEIKMNRAANVALASLGGDQFEDYPTYAYSDIEYDKEGNSVGYTKAYYIQSGVVNVTKDGLTLEGKSIHGSTVKISYKGEIKLVDPFARPEEAPAKLVRK